MIESRAAPLDIAGKIAVGVFGDFDVTSYGTYKLDEFLGWRVEFEDGSTLVLVPGSHKPSLYERSEGHDVLEVDSG